MPNQDNWKVYYERTDGKPPRPTLAKALELFEKENKIGKAFDIGCGVGNDIAYLLSKDWEVIGTDNELKAQNHFNQKFKSEVKASFQFCSFEEIKWEKVLLVHAGFSLPFCSKDEIHQVLTNIKSNIKVGGRFAGNFFGPNHTWNDLCLLSKKEIEDYFSDFTIEWLEETETDRLSTLDEKIHHHNIAIIAKKNS